MGKSYRFQRRVEFRRTKKLFLIAAEGAQTEPVYFEELKSIVATRDAIIRMKLVANPNHKSHPKEVLTRLIRAANQEGIKNTDELWLVVDRDAWAEKDLIEVCKAAKDRGYFVAASNPCFELWLFLHLRNNRVFVDRHQCQREFGSICKSYQTNGKSGYDAKALMPKVQTAVKRAKLLDTSPHEHWPKTQGTRVYILVERLLAGASM